MCLDMGAYVWHYIYLAIEGTTCADAAASAAEASCGEIVDGVVDAACVVAEAAGEAVAEGEPAEAG